MARTDSTRQAPAPLDSTRVFWKEGRRDPIYTTLTFKLALIFSSNHPIHTTLTFKLAFNL